MDKQNFAFDKWNYILLAVGVAAIIIGFALMTGPGSTETHFEPDIFSVRRIKVAPTVCFFGFLFVIYAIIHKPQNKKFTKNSQLKMQFFAFSCNFFANFGISHVHATRFE